MYYIYTHTNNLISNILTKATSYIRVLLLPQVHVLFSEACLLFPQGMEVHTVLQEGGGRGVTYTKENNSIVLHNY